MKLRTSFFDKTVFFKNVTRFAPVWGLYALGLLMALMTMASSDLEYWQVDALGESIQLMPLINMGYALVCAMLLFGDLFNARMCNALHALPLRRECWFCTNVFSGLAFSVVPNLIMTLIAIPLCAASIVTDAWQVPLYWLLGSTLQFVAFFGIAVFSIFCAGSKFASLVVYGILNFFSVLVYVLVAAVYSPMLYGVHTSEVPFMNFCPVIRMMEEGYIHTEQLWAETYPPQLMGGIFTLGENWGSLWLFSAVGAVLILIALLMYRKRHLESAGDFIAVNVLRPVFLIIYTLCAGVAFFAFQRLFVGGGFGYFWLYIGLAVGFFTGLILLERTVRVFRKKTFALCGVLMLVFALTTLTTALDLFGIESWMPEKAEVKSVTVYDRHVYYAANYDTLDGLTLEGDDIDKGLRLHELALEDQHYFDDFSIGLGYYVTDVIAGYNGGVSRNSVSFTLVYELADGRRVARYYYGFVDSEIGEILTPLFSAPELVLDFPASQIPDFVTRIEEIMLDGELVTEKLDAAQQQALLEAIAADCEEGTMAQNWAFHRTEEDPVYYLEFQYQERDIYSNWKTITVFPECRHTREFLEESGLLAYLESLDSRKYG